MNLPTIMPVKMFTKIVSVVVLLMASANAYGEWSVDLSRRQKDIRQQELKSPAPQVGEKTFLQNLFSAETVANDIVILNTDKGFVPNTVRLRRDVKYRLHVVNVNIAEKNVSFVMEAFSEHHATYFGTIKTFEVHPQKEGVFSFHCPETSLEGKVIVFQTEGVAAPQAIRFPASE